MKKNYDKASSVRRLEPKDLALILLPTDGNKLFARWRGSYRVLRWCENNNYELLINERKAMLHMNSLRKYNEGESNMNHVETVNVIISDELNIQAELADEADSQDKQQGNNKFHSHRRAADT